MKKCQKWRITSLIFRLGCWMFFMTFGTALHAASGAFGADGKSLWFSRFESPSLHVFQLDSGQLDEVDLSQWAGEEARVNAIVLDPSGLFVVSAGGKLLTLNPQNREVKVIADLRPGRIITELALNPRTSEIFVVSMADDPSKPLELGIYSFRLDRGVISNRKEWGARRIPNLSGLDFSKDGMAYFGVDGDLWVGNFLAFVGDDDLSENAETPQFSGALTGFRIAPIATPETGEGNGHGEGVREVVWTPGNVYVAFGNRYGTTLIRMDEPQLAADPETGLAIETDIALRAGLSMKTMKSIQVLSPNGKSMQHSALSNLCKSPSEQDLFLYSEGEVDSSFMFLRKGKWEAIVLKP